MKKQYIINKNQQSGVVLIISLIMLVIMTLVGTAGVRAITKEERIVAQAYDRSLAFQAAESALRQAEISIENNGRPTPTAVTSVSTTCTSYGSGATAVKVCGAAITLTTPRWNNSSFSQWTDGTAVGTGTLRITPTYFVEYLGDNMPCAQQTTTVSASCMRYRVTAKASPGSDRSTVVLQSIYATTKD